MYTSITYPRWRLRRRRSCKKLQRKSLFKICKHKCNVPIILSVPVVNLEDFEEQECYKQIKNLHNFKQTNKEDLSSKILNNFLRTDNSPNNSCKFYNVTDEDRTECIKKLLRLDHLNQD